MSIETEMLLAFVVVLSGMIAAIQMVWVPLHVTGVERGKQRYADWDARWKAERRFLLWQTALWIVNATVGGSAFAYGLWLSERAGQ